MHCCDHATQYQVMEVSESCWEVNKAGNLYSSYCVCVFGADSHLLMAWGILRGGIILYAHSSLFHSCYPSILLTWFDGTVDIGSGLVVDPVESRFHRQSCQHPQPRFLSIRSGNVYGTTFIVEFTLTRKSILVPGFRDPQLNPGPLVHHRYSQRVEFLFATLQNSDKKGRVSLNHVMTVMSYAFFYVAELRCRVDPIRQLLHGGHLMKSI